MKKITCLALLFAMALAGCVSVATVDRYAAEKNISALQKIMVDDRNDAAIRRAATIKLGKFHENSAKAYLVQLIKGDALGKEDRSEQARKEQQVLAVKLLSAYGADNAEDIINALKAVEPVSLRSELAVQVTADLGVNYSIFIYEIAKEPELPAAQAQMVLNYLAPMADRNVRMCFYYYDVVDFLNKSSDNEKKAVAESVVSILPVCSNRHFDQKAWLVEPRFMAAYEQAQSARVPFDEKLSRGEAVTLSDAEPSMKHLREALKIDPPNPLARYSMARIYQAMGMNEEAGEWIKSVFPTAPDWGIAYGLLCDLEYKRGKMRLATDACKVAVEKAPNVAWHYYLPGYIFKRRGKFQEAYNAFTYATNIDPKNYDLLLKDDLTYLRKVLKIN